MTAAELAEYEAWLDVDPQDQYRADLRAAQTTAAVAAGNGVRCRPLDYMPIVRSLMRGDGPAAVQPVQQMLSAARLAARLCGGRRA